MSHKNTLLEEIRNMLAQQCTARSLDDKEDFEAVMQAIEDVIREWINSRCPGCR